MYFENLKKKNTIWSNTMLDCERSVTRTLFMDENSVIEVTKI